VAGEGRDDDVEGVLGPASVGRWIGERSNDLEVLDDRPRPAVGDDHRQRMLVTRTDVDEMNVDTIDGGFELRQAVERGFDLSPVVASTPIPNELLQSCQLHALRLISNGFLVRPPRSSDPPAKVMERRLRYLGFEGP